MKKKYWLDRRVVAIDLSFEDFLVALDGAITHEERTLASIPASDGNKTSFTRFISDVSKRESVDLKVYLKSLVEHIVPEMIVSPGDPKKFFKGFDLGWYPITSDLDVKQGIVDELISEEIVKNPEQGKQTLVAVKGHAGSGKTIALRRACYEAAVLYERLCFYISRRSVLDVDRFEEIFSLTNVPVYVFIDNISEHRDAVQRSFEIARRMKITLKIIGTETYATWNTVCEDLSRLTLTEYELRYLSREAIDDLISKLSAHGSLGYLERLSSEQRHHELSHVHGRQLLVALLEATHGTPLMEIIASEYYSIQDNKAKLIYLDICSLHRFGPPVRAGIISRIHNVSFTEFENVLFKSLDHIVVLRKDPKSGDYVYEARHSHIANAVYETVLTRPEERFDNLIRVLSKLNPAFSYDLEVLGRTIKADNLDRIIADPDKVRQIYDVVDTGMGPRALIFQQRGIYEMNIATNLGELNISEVFIQKAIALEPFNRSLKHSLAEIDLRRSRISSDRLSKKTWRRSAEERAGALLSGNSSAYPHHTLLKCAIDEVKDAIGAAEGAQGDDGFDLLGDAIARAEAVLKRALQNFPNDPPLLFQEGELRKALQQGEKAELAFQKAFAANPRSTLIARRLARVKRARSLQGDALEVLRKCIEHNPSAQDLHYDMAQTYMEMAPDADQVHAAAIGYHLRRAYAQGDKNLQAQFWHARQLCIENKYDEARPIFKKLSEARMPFVEKNQVRGVLKNSENVPIRFHGVIAAIKNTYGFVRVDKPSIDAFFTINDIDASLAEDLIDGLPVAFELGFCLRGPVAQNLSII